MRERGVDALVVGAGIAGLAAASDLARAGVCTLVVDANARPGGVMQTDEVGGYVVEAGPSTFQAKAPFCAFVERHGVEESLAAAASESRRRSLFRGGRLVDLPRNPLAVAATTLLSPSGKLRMLAEPFVRRGDPSGESVYDFVARRLGAEVATGVVGAFLTGVYAGDERRLGIEAVFPGLVELEREYGSLVRGGVARLFRRGRAAPRGRPGTWSAVGGLGQLAATLAALLPEPPLQATRVVGLARDAEGWRAEARTEVSDGETGDLVIRARQVVLATPAYAAAPLLESLAPAAAHALAAIEHAPIATVALGVDPSEVRAPIDGFGFIVSQESGLSLLGCLFMSRLFPGRAPPGRELLHLMLGGVRWPDAVRVSDEDLTDRALRDLDACLGLHTTPEVVAVRRIERAIPQPGPEHVRLIADVDRRIAALPGLTLAGSYLAGISVADALASGVRAAETLLRAD